MSVLLTAMVLLTWLVGLLRYGPFSFVVAGIFCFTIYSIPALSGLAYPFVGMHLTAASPTA